MKTRKDVNPVERIGDTGKETEFTITSSPQAFEILSSGIYTDPIMAVIRELSCNAYDAMVEADKGDQPFKIHLPNKLEPFFSVTDDGIGLCDADVRGLYASYFQSTKTNTNDQIGAFGLGSKSPFSYSKAFDIISRFNGTKHIYTVLINEKGVPAIQDGATNPTDECNGIEIKISVREGDYFSFKQKASEILRFFPIKPIILGANDFDFPEPPASAIITPTYIVDKTSNGVAIAVQGNVPYKVDPYKIARYISDACRNFMDKHSITLFFDIGDLEVAASREEVRYDERTAKNIANAMQLAFDDYLSQLDIQISDLTKAGSIWEIYTLLREKFGSRSSLESLVGKEFKFTSDRANDWMKKDKLEYNVAWKYHKIIPYKKGEVRAVRANHDWEGCGTERKFHIRPEANTRVVIQDVTTRGSLRMNTKLTMGYMSGAPKILMAIVPTTDRALANAGVTATTKERAAELKEITKQFGNPEVKKISEWTDDVVPAVRAARANGHAFKAYDFPTYRSDRKRKPTFSEVPEPTDGGLYIEIDHLRNVMMKGEKVGLTSGTLADMIVPVLKVINLARGTDYKPKNVYGLTKKVVKYISGDSKWESLFSAYSDTIVTHTDIIEYYRRIGNSHILNLSSAINRFSFIQMIKELDTTSDFRQLVEPVIEASKDAATLSKHADFALSKDDFLDELRKFERLYGLTHDVNDESFFTEDDVAPYPMLKHVNFGYEEDRKDAKAYIELVESN